ncbi:MAG: hypothetical protein KIS66_03595 [Fimbriimonadaceae bacterium]|nr:hypothetical protein [Fimbriimonadaceae bacterium]
MRRAMALGAMATLVLAGCGGTGSSTGMGGNTGYGYGSGFGGSPMANNSSNPDRREIPLGRRFALIATDTTKKAFSQAWVRVYALDMVRGESVSRVFEDGQGRSLDLCALGTKQARSLFLGEGALGAGDFERFRVILGDELVVFTKDSATPKTYKVVGAKDGKATVEANVAGSRRLKGGNGDMEIDFNVANWVIEGETVRPALKDGPEPGNDDFRNQMRGDHAGRVRDLSERNGAREFTLLDRSGRTVRVVTDQDTAIVGAGTAPLLEADRPAMVRGTYDARQRALVAETIVLLADDRAPSAMHGLATMAQDGGGFTLKVEQARGFLPDRLTVKVTADRTTKIVGDRGAAISLDDLLGRIKAQKVLPVSVEGEIDAKEGAVAATIVRVERAR